MSTGDKRTCSRKTLHSNKRLNFYGSRHLTVWGVRQRDNLKSTLFDFASFTWKLISQSDTSGFARQKIANELHKFTSRKFSLFMLKSFMLEHLRLAGWSGKKSAEGFSSLEIMLSFGFIVFLRATRNKLWGEIIHKLGFVTWLLSFASPCECVDLSRAVFTLHNYCKSPPVGYFNSRTAHTKARSVECKLQRILCLHCAISPR